MREASELQRTAPLPENHWKIQTGGLKQKDNKNVSRGTKKGRLCTGSAAGKSDEQLTFPEFHFETEAKVDFPSACI